MADPKDIRSGLTIERLKETLDYDPETGIFTWSKVLRRKKIVRGSIAGCLRFGGGWAIRLDGVLYYAHRLAWFYMTGEWPVDVIDHKNRIASDNRWCNLREATCQQNQVNKLLDNSTGYSNVDKIGKRYRARARFDGKLKHLGMANTAAEAHAISVSERRKVHGEFVVSQIGEI